MRAFAWLLGLALVAAVILAALHASEEREFLRLLEVARPGWLLVAVALQAGTYLAQGQSWRIVVRAARGALSLSSAARLALAKLFIDQAIPSVGISGTVVMAAALERGGVPRRAVMAAVAVDTVAYYAAYVLGLAAAVVVTIRAGHGNGMIVAAAALFGLVAGALVVCILGLSGRRARVPERIRRIRPARIALERLGEADPGLVRSPALLSQATLLQLAIVGLDAASVWVLLRALGSAASPAGVFASFMLSALLRTVGFVPGGLGTFEAASVVTLRLTGVGLAEALAATLLFRGLSFWLPMLPGLWFARRVGVGSAPAPGPSASSTGRRRGIQ